MCLLVVSLCWQRRGVRVGRFGECEWNITESELEEQADVRDDEKSSFPKDP